MIFKVSVIKNEYLHDIVMKSLDYYVLSSFEYRKVPKIRRLGTVVLDVDRGPTLML